MEKDNATTTEGAPAQREDRVTVHWVGDISLNGSLCSPQCHQSLQDRMAKLQREAGPCEVCVGNFEAPLWGDGSENLLKKTRVCTTEQTARCILPLGLDLVFRGNNHVYDCREAGFRNTSAFLRENGIEFLGAGTNPEEAARPVILNRSGVSLGFLNYVHQNTHPSLPADAGISLNYFEEERALSEIVDLSRRVDAVLLYLHWGAEELVRLPSLAQRRFGRRAVEAGARVVVFDHAHCLQPHEPWGHGHIIYGLGNFIFGDLPDGPWPVLARHAAIARIGISRVGAVEVSFRYLLRRDQLLDWDDRKSRARSHTRLNRCLRLTKGQYRIIYECEKIYQHGIVPCLQFVAKHGGIFPSLCKIRKRHLQKAAAMMGHRSRGAAPEKAENGLQQRCELSSGCLGVHEHASE